MKKERKVSHLLFMAVVALLLLPLAALALSSFEIELRQFGLGALATWVRGAGEPGPDEEQWGLYLQKHTATSTLAAAQALITKITPFPAQDLNVLAFDIPGRAGTPTFGVANGYCGAGAPRFSVNSDAGTCSLGCAHGVKTQDPNTGWWEIRFDAPFTQFPGCEVGVVGTITRIRIIFDEGTDLGPGNVVLDNIRVNDQVEEKP